jgi:hypothetical protein
LDKVKEFNQSKAKNLDLEEEVTDEEDISEDVKNRLQMQVEKGYLGEDVSGGD